MRILWFTGRQRKMNRSFYGGGGWIRSLGSELVRYDNVELAWSYFSDEKQDEYDLNGIHQYPMNLKPKNKFKKIYDYWALNPEYSDEYLLDCMQAVIRKFQPDVIQVFGTESMFTSLIGKTDIPVILYIQGVLNPIANAYYPYAMNEYTLKYWRFDKREWLFKNGRIYREKQLAQLAENEKIVFRKAKYIVGRTHLDYEVSRFFSPSSYYFKVNEMMREPFYEGKQWVRPQTNSYRIFSTLSNVTYKGFDVILKTAKLLKEHGCNFHWRIAGLTEKDEIVALFEKLTGIRSGNVNVEYLGILGEKELKTALLESHVLVHPSYIDNSPNSVGEAQLLGLPVVACYVGGVPDFIKSGVTGELVPANDPYSLAYILNKDMEEPFLYEYSQPAYEEATQRHDKKTILSDILNVYKEVAK